MAYDVSTLSVVQISKLNSLHNRASRYEVLATFAATESHGETRVLIGYTCHRSRHGLLKCCQAQGQAIIDAFGICDNDRFIPAKRAAGGFTIGKWSFNFSGRTQREAIMEGEIVSISEVLNGRKTVPALA